MSSSSPESQTAPPSYASLRSGTPTANGAAEIAYWQKEAEKVDTLLQSMWVGFVEAPSNSLPTALADYVAAYTSAMRLKLTLMGYSAVPAARNVRSNAVTKWGAKS